MILNCSAGKDSWESLQQQGDQTSQSQRKSTLNIHWKDWCWSWSFNTLATWCEDSTHLKRPWYWEGLKAGGEGDDREWDGWMASPTGWTWVWVSSRSWRWTGKPGCYSRWFYKASDMTEELNRTDKTENTDIVCLLIICLWLWVNILDHQTFNKFCTIRPIHWATKIQIP